MGQGEDGTRGSLWPRPTLNRGSFNPRPREGGRPEERPTTHQRLQVSIHAPVRGATVRFDGQHSCRQSFNPHPREGGDSREDNAFFLQRKFFLKCEPLGIIMHEGAPAIARGAVSFVSKELAFVRTSRGNRASLRFARAARKNVPEGP